MLGAIWRFVRQVWEVDRGLSHGLQLTRAVVRGLYKLMAYKDEYEVARLATRNGSEERMRSFVRWGGENRPATASAHDAGACSRARSAFGKGLRLALVLLSRLKGLRGTAFDLFGRIRSCAALGTRTDWLVLRVDRRGLAGTN